ncbi:FAD dependent oxidoreductase [Annulohypoxylon truncatum]|uniref:FAD dependent oxidoreductase n=1 Tax=Annulohypoxylon truncatum TaxID=327061 RepID=UPI002007E065|nr:FAD dependent oxidoreductase [Annulohypoxylon truncatum]KAI1204650.1 FAD dependent oxidoreductase [Annulohypoxylon truncatum]
MSQAQLLRGQSGLPVDNPTKSYWHKEPSAKLLGHRTTKELPRSADVVIVGSGITGTFAAHFMKELRPDLDVVMVEAREACWGATGRNGGHCQPAIYTSEPHVASFELRNYFFLKDLVEKFSIPCDWHTTSGVHAFYSPVLFAAVRRRVEYLMDEYPDLAANVALVTKGKPGEDSNVEGTPAYLLEGERRELTLDALRVPHAEGAVVQWNAASLWPYKLVAFVLERLLAANDDEEQGGGRGGGAKGSFNLQTNTPVTGLSRAETPDLSSHHESAKSTSTSIWTVHTPRGAIAASKVLLATNGYTSHLLPQFAPLIVPTQGQVSALEPPEKPASPSDPPLDIKHTFYVEGEPGAPYERDDYLVQRPPASAELIYGGGRRHAKGRGVAVWDDSYADDAVSWYLRGELGSVVDLSLHQHQHHPASQPSSNSNPSSSTQETKPATEEQKHHQKPLPGKQDLHPTHEWTGIMGYSKDAHPWVGAVPSSAGGDDGGGLWLCAGYTGHGMPNAVLSAKAVVDMMYGGGGGGETPAIDLPPEYELTEDRLARSRLLDEVADVDAKGSLYADFGAR